jgi:hypothetical protein
MLNQIASFFLKKKKKETRTHFLIDCLSVCFCESCWSGGTPLWGSAEVYQGPVGDRGPRRHLDVDVVHVELRQSPTREQLRVVPPRWAAGEVEEADRPWGKGQVVRLDTEEGRVCGSCGMGDGLAKQWVQDPPAKALDNQTISYLVFVPMNTEGQKAHSHQIIAPKNGQ